MRIKITRKYSKYQAVCEVLNKESRQALIDAACGMYGAYWDLTLGRFFAISAGDVSFLEIKRSPTVAQVFWLKGLEDFAKEFEQACKNVQMPKTLLRKNEDQAARACLKMTPQESMLTFVQKHFGLHSYREAEQITLAEYMMARRAQYNEVVMQRRLEQLQMAEIKKGQKK